MGRGKLKVKEKKRMGLFKISNIMTSKEAEAYFEMLNKWVSSRELSEYQHQPKANKKKIDKRKMIHTSTGRYLNNLVKFGWVHCKYDCVLFETKKGPARRKVPFYRSNIKPFIDNFIRNFSDGEINVYMEHPNIEKILYLFFEFDIIKKRINTYSIISRHENLFLSQVSKFGTLTTTKLNDGINFNGLVVSFKYILDQDLLFNQMYYSGIFNENIINKIRIMENDLIENKFKKTNKLIENYWLLKKDQKDLFEQRNEITDSFEEEYKEIIKLKSYKASLILSKFFHPKCTKKMNLENTKIRYISNLLYDPKSFNGFRALFLGYSANRLINFMKQPISS